MKHKKDSKDIKKRKTLHKKEQNFAESIVLLFLFMDFCRKPFEDEQGE